MKAIDAKEIEGLLAQMASDLKATLEERGLSNPLMVGIHSGGVWIAEHLHRSLAHLVLPRRFLAHRGQSAGQALATAAVH